MSDTVKDLLNIRPEIVYFGQVSTREGIKRFGMLDDDRRRHMYILGKTGMGKRRIISIDTQNHNITLSGVATGSVTANLLFVQPVFKGVGLIES